MEDKKNDMRLDDEKMEQVAGGFGDKPYSECCIYKFLLSIKSSTPEEAFRQAASIYFKGECIDYEKPYKCYICPVYAEWRK